MWGKVVAVTGEMGEKSYCYGRINVKAGAAGENKIHNKRSLFNYFHF